MSPILPLPGSPAPQTESKPRTRIPLWLKLGYTLFMAVLIPVYWKNYLVTWMGALLVGAFIPVHFLLQKFVGRVRVLRLSR